MSREHELMTELRDARRRLLAARIAEQDARTALSERKAARMKVEKDLEEILGEVETGSTGRPILDAINGAALAAAAEDAGADSQQRGPTAEPKRRRGRPHKLEQADGPPVLARPAAESWRDPVALAQADDAEPTGPGEWTSADLERELRDAVLRVGPKGDATWTRLGMDGCDDAKILEVLRARWPGSYLAIEGTGSWFKRQVGKTVHGGPTPAFWIGARKHTDWKIAPPQLSGLQLADRVRRVLGIPRAKVLAEVAP